MIDNTVTGSKPSVTFYKTNVEERVKIPYNIEEIVPGIYSWHELDIKPVHFNYGGLVSELIGIKYSDDEMIAIINNYLFDNNDEDAKLKFEQMQEYRIEAKNIAKTIIDTYK
jgi:hypothetical protein